MPTTKMTSARTVPFYLKNVALLWFGCSCSRCLWLCCVYPRLIENVFTASGVPLDVLVLDMDWHTTSESLF